MKNTLSEEQVFELWGFLHRTKTTLNRARQKELNRHGISLSTAAVLDCIKNSGEYATPTQVSRWIIRSPQAISGILDRMEKADLLVKYRDPKRKNAIRLMLTKEGERVHKQISKRKSINKIISSLSDEEIQQLKSCLKKMGAVASKLIKDS